MKTHIIALLLLTGGVLNLFGENLHNFFNRYNFSFITEDTGLPHNFINDIYKDTQGYIWVATNKGLNRIDPQTLSVKIYQLNDRLANNEFSERASINLFIIIPSPTPFA